MTTRYLPLLAIVFTLLGGCSALCPTHDVIGPVPLNKAVAEVP